MNVVWDGDGVKLLSYSAITKEECWKKKRFNLSITPL